MSITTKTNAKEILNIDNADYDTYITNLLDPITDIIEKYCDRAFGATDYKIWVQGYDGYRLYLPQYPINTVSRVAVDKVDVVDVECQVSGATRAYVSVTSTGITFGHVTSAGASSSTTLAFADYATLILLAAAIPASWVMTIKDSDFNNYPSADLIPIQAAPCLDGEDDEYTLEMPYNDIVVKIGDFENGEIEAVDESFPSGRKLVYVEFNAGYTEPDDTEGAEVTGNMPAALQTIAAMMIQNGINSLNEESNSSDRAMKSERLGDYTYTRRDEGIFLTDEIKEQLYPFCKPSI